MAGNLHKYNNKFESKKKITWSAQSESIQQTMLKQLDTKCKNFKHSSFTLKKLTLNRTQT